MRRARATTQRLIGAPSAGLPVHGAAQLSGGGSATFMMFAAAIVSVERPGPSGSNALAAAEAEPALGGATTSEELARRAGGGCAESFAALVARHGGGVFSYLLRMTGNLHDAEDLTQETFLKVFRSLGRADAPVAFTAWLFTIARRTALNHFRAARPVEELDPDTASGAPDPAAVTAATEDRRSLWALAKRLKRPQFEALWLRYAEGLSVREIARVMRLHSIHVRVLLHRGRQQLARRLAAAPGPTGLRSLRHHPKNLVP
jgi:RNA polymerase sigma-70 factor, ECF subfamily